MSVIKFGTDGWRAVISDAFTFENVRKVAPNIDLTLLLMIGFDNEPKDRFEPLLKLVEEIKPYGVYLSILTPLPGSQTALQLEKEGRIFDRNWRHYDTRHLVFRPRYQINENQFREMAPDDFTKGYDWLVDAINSFLSKQARVSPIPIR